MPDVEVEDMMSVRRDLRRRRCVCLCAAAIVLLFSTGTSLAQVAYVDPQTGGLAASPPPGGQIVTGEENARGSLEVVDSPVPGGGKMIVLDRRFMPAAVATIGANGHVSGGCVAATEAERAIKHAAGAAEAVR